MAFTDRELHCLSYPLFAWALESSKGNVSVQRCRQKAEGRALKDLLNVDKKFEKNMFKQYNFLNVMSWWERMN